HAITAVDGGVSRSDIDCVIPGTAVDDAVDYACGPAEQIISPAKENGAVDNAAVRYDVKLSTHIHVADDVTRIGHSVISKPERDQSFDRPTSDDGRCLICRTVYLRFNDCGGGRNAPGVLDIGS